MKQDQVIKSFNNSYETPNIPKTFRDSAKESLECIKLSQVVKQLEEQCALVRHETQTLSLLDTLSLVLETGLSCSFTVELQLCLRELVNSLHLVALEHDFSEKARIAALECLEKVIRAVPKQFTGYWSKFIPVSDNELGLLALANRSDAPRVQKKALTVLAAMLKDSRPFLSMANQFDRKGASNFTSLSERLAVMQVRTAETLTRLLYSDAGDAEERALVLVATINFIENASFAKLDEAVLENFLPAVVRHVFTADFHVQVTALRATDAYVDALARNLLHSSINAPVSDSMSTVSMISLVNGRTASDTASELSAAQQNAVNAGAATLFKVLQTADDGSDMVSFCFETLRADKIPEPLQTALFHLLTTLTKYFFKHMEMYRAHYDAVFSQRPVVAEALAFLGDYLRQCREASVPLATLTVPFALLESLFDSDSVLGDASFVTHAVNAGTEVIQLPPLDALAGLQAQSLDFALRVLDMRDSEAVAIACYRCIGIFLVQTSNCSQAAAVEVSLLRRLHGLLTSGAAADSEKRINVRVRAGWALANFWDLYGRVDAFKDFPFLKANIGLALGMLHDNEKCRANGIRGIGSLIGSLPLALYSSDAEYAELANKAMPLVLRMSEAGPLKTRWNAAHAISKVLRNPTVLSSPSTLTASWHAKLLQLLPRLITSSKNFKVKINAASAISALSLADVPETVLPDAALRQQLLFKRLTVAPSAPQHAAFQQLKLLLEALWSAYQECKLNACVSEGFAKYKAQLERELCLAAFKLCHSARLLVLPPSIADSLANPLSASMDVSFVLNTNSSRQTQDELLHIAHLWSLFQLN